MTTHSIPRRVFLKSSVASAATLGAATSVRAGDDGTAFPYEVQRSEAEWRAMLSDDEYRILREFDTELPTTSDLWDETRNGHYCCRGCDLTLYDSTWKVELDIGWAFFSQGRLNAMLMGTDDPAIYDDYGMRDPNAPPAVIEVHCRRCGSHLGHLLTVHGTTLHCINGRSLTFTETAA